MIVVENKNYLGMKTSESYWKVMIVDDSKFQLEQIERLLESEKFEVCGKAENGEEAIKLYRQLKPDLVLMDIQMPGINGIETTKKIKEQFPDARIIACTSLNNKKFVQDAILAGCLHYIVKPIKRVSFFECIKYVIDKINLK